MGSGIWGQSPCLQRAFDSLPVFLSLTMVLKVNQQNFAERHFPATLVPDIITAHSQDGLARDRETQEKDGECSLAIARRMTLVRSAFMLIPRWLRVDTECPTNQGVQCLSCSKHVSLAGTFRTSLEDIRGRKKMYIWEVLALSLGWVFFKPKKLQINSFVRCFFQRWQYSFLCLLEVLHPVLHPSPWLPST